MSAHLARALLTAPLAASSVAAAPALACRVAFASSDGSVLYQCAPGTGTVTCSDGSRMAARTAARGTGPSAGKRKLADGFDMSESICGFFIERMPPGSP